MQMLDVRKRFENNVKLFDLELLEGGFSVCFLGVTWCHGSLLFCKMNETFILNLFSGRFLESWITPIL